jgi:DNA-binding HxlR family transcriptional regulator
MIVGIAKRDNEVIKYLIAYQAKHFRMPTRKEVCFDLKIWPGVLDRVLKRLENEGRVKRIPISLNIKVLK